MSENTKPEELEVIEEIEDLLVIVDRSKVKLLPATKGVEKFHTLVEGGQICLNPSQVWPEEFPVSVEFLEESEGKETPEVLIIGHRIAAGSGTLPEVFSFQKEVFEKGTLVDEQIIMFCRKFPDELRSKNLFPMKEGEEEFVVVLYRNEQNLVVKEKYSLKAPRLFTPQDCLLVWISYKITT